MRRLSLISLLCAFLACACACKMISGLVHDREAVARVGDHVLYVDEVGALIPAGLSQEDSLGFVRRYIDSWATDMLLMDQAEQQLSPAEKDVSRQLADYRKSLLKYRYEQQYVNERLDTAISAAEVEAYYESRREQFRLDAPLVKARHMRYSTKSPVRESLRSRIAAPENPAADSTFLPLVSRYQDFGGQWTPLPVVAREMGMAPDEILSRLKGKTLERADEGTTYYLYVQEILRAGELAPLSYCEKQIRDILLSLRKQDLVSSLERDLLEDARTKAKLIVFDE